MDQATLTFPPLLKGHEFHEEKILNASSGELLSESPVPPTDLVRSTFEKARLGELSAGDLVWSSSKEVTHCAIVLEPEISTEKSLTMIPLAMVAIADSLGAISPPNLGITFGWPGMIFANGARLGNVSMYFPKAQNFANIPEFAVLSISINILWPETSNSDQGQEPGNDLAKTVLHEEGCGDVNRDQIIESWSRHFLTWIDTWQQEGFEPVHENWLFRAKDRNEHIQIQIKNREYEGKLIGLDETGGALLKSDDETVNLVSMAEVWENSPNKEIQ